eukprot:Skav223439  [mRNA]  locus=scaffold350:635868:652181:+ [translate_table: standard]
MAIDFVCRRNHKCDTVCCEGFNDRNHEAREHPLCYEPVDRLCLGRNLGSGQEGRRQQAGDLRCESFWPCVPISQPAELLDRDWPEPEVSCMQACGFCTSQAPSLLSSKPAVKPAITFKKARLSDTTIQAEPVVRSPVACSQVRSKRPAEDNLCSRLCGPDCASSFKEVHMGIN